MLMDWVGKAPRRRCLHITYVYQLVGKVLILVLEPFDPLQQQTVLRPQGSHLHLVFKLFASHLVVVFLQPVPDGQQRLV